MRDRLNRRRLRVKRHRCRLGWERRHFIGKKNPDIRIRRPVNQFANMPGSKLLEYVRDELHKLAIDRRDYWDRNQRFSPNPLADDWLERVALLDGVAAALDYIVAVGRDYSISRNGKSPPEWVRMVCAQIRAQLVDQVVEYKDGKPAVVDAVDRARSVGADPGDSPEAGSESQEERVE